MRIAIFPAVLSCVMVASASPVWAQTPVAPMPAAPVANAMPAPSADSLQPIPAVTTPAPGTATTTTTTVTTPAVTSTQTTTTGAPVAAGAAVAPAGAATAAAAPAALTKEQQTQAAVQAILGEQVKAIAPPVPNAMNASDLLARGVVVTPNAKEVVFVKKGASAKSDRAVFAAADRAYVDGQYGTAVELYDRILRSSPSNKIALNGKALALYKAGRTDEALQTYERLSLLDPTNVSATANYMSLLRQKDPQRALSRLQNLEQQYPNRPALQGQVGMVYADMNDTPNAVRAFSRAAALDPNNPVFAFNLGALYDRLGNDQKAGQYYRTALQIAGTDETKAKNIPVESIRDRLKSLHD